MAAVSTDVLVVGAGAAGIFTAALLKEKGLDVLVLEEKDTIGGICQTRHSERGEAHVYDLTTTFVCNEPGSVLHQLFAGLGIDLLPYRPAVCFDTTRGASTLPPSATKFTQLQLLESLEHVGEYCGGLFGPAADRAARHLDVLEVAEAMDKHSPGSSVLSLREWASVDDLRLPFSTVFCEMTNPNGGAPFMEAPAAYVIASLQHLCSPVVYGTFLIGRMVGPRNKTSLDAVRAQEVEGRVLSLFAFPPTDPLASAPPAWVVAQGYGSLFVRLAERHQLHIMHRHRVESLEVGSPHTLCVAPLDENAPRITVTAKSVVFACSPGALVGVPSFRTLSHPPRPKYISIAARVTGLRTKSAVYYPAAAADHSWESASPEDVLPVFHLLGTQRHADNNVLVMWLYAHGVASLDASHRAFAAAVERQKGRVEEFLDVWEDAAWPAFIHPADFHAALRATRDMQTRRVFCVGERMASLYVNNIYHHARALCSRFF